MSLHFILLCEIFNKPLHEWKVSAATTSLYKIIKIDFRDVSLQGNAKKIHTPTSFNFIRKNNDDESKDLYASSIRLNL